MNIYSVHMDATFWKDPEVFRPERHLDNDGRIIRNDHLIPFGVGKFSVMRRLVAKPKQVFHY